MAELVDAVPRRQLAKWLALARMDGWGREEERHAELLAELHNAGLVARGGEVKAESFRNKFDYLDPYPWGPKKPAPDTKELTPEECAAMEASLKRMAGL